MPQQPFLEIIFAHHDEPIPVPFALPAGLSERQLRRWKSRRMARFLLQQRFAAHQLDLSLLDNIQRTASGRPFVDCAQLDFNISDSGEWVALIISYAAQYQAVGIDIEHPQKERPYANLIRHYANAEEISEWLTTATEQPQLKQRFYLSWCLREAVLKAQGVGIVKLSEVRHLPSQQQIYSAYCPQGMLHFHHQLPFYLCYFYQNSSTIAPTLLQWQHGDLQKIEHLSPLVYAVNQEQTDE